MSKVKIIAEIGVNHNGKIDLAKKLILRSKQAGADYVKFQLFSSKSLSTLNAKKADYQILKDKKNETQYQMLKRYELNYFQIKKLINFSKKKKIKFLLSVFDLESLKIFKKLNLDTLKIPSGEINNFELIEKISNLKKKLIISTGMSTYEEINRTFKFLKKKNRNQLITLLHCVSSYPTKPQDVYLNTMEDLFKKFKTPVGFSDHTDDYISSVCAVCKGATIIEKHITLSKNLKGPDHKSSLDPEQFKKFVDSIRTVEKILKKVKNKKFSKDEVRNSKVVRKSIIAKKKIKKGDIFTRDNITTKRPSNGISASEWFQVLGRKSKKNFQIDELIKL